MRCGERKREREREGGRGGVRGGGRRERIIYEERD